MAIALENSGSAVIAELEISRIFSQLVTELQAANNFKYDLMFILTPTGSLNHEATGKFIDHLQSNIKERIKLVLCLDSLSNIASATKSLFVFQSQLSQSDSLSASFLSELRRASSKKSLSFEVRDSLPHFTGKKFVQHEHAIYNEKGIPAITISAKSNIYNNRNEKYSVFDTAISNDDLSRNILVISEALVKVIYTFTEKKMNFFIDNEFLVSQNFIN